MISNSKKWLVIIILLQSLLIGKCIGQIIVVDSTSNDPVPYVEVFTDDGKYIGGANDKGIIELTVIDKIRLVNETANLVFGQMAYNKRTFTKAEALAVKTITLTPKFINLEDAIVTPNKNALVILSGYYRSYQLRGDKLEYFADGNIEIVYDQKKSLHKRLAERSWFNKNMPPRSNFSIDMVGPPIPDIKTITELEKGQKNIIYSLSKSIENKNISLIEVLKNDSENVRSIKVFGNTSIINFYKEKFIFKTSDPKNNGIDFLDYYSINKHLRFKCKECDDFQDYSMQSEFFVTDVKYSNTISKKEYSRFEGYPKYSHFKDEYWKEAEKHRLFQPLNEKIKELLKSQLTMNPVE